MSVLLFGTKLNMLFLKKGSYIEKWSDLNEQNRVCKVDITPPVGIDFVGYHRETGINNIEERIYGTVFVFEKMK